MKKILQLGSMLFMVAALSACGFHLRQPETLAPQLQTLYVETSTPNDPFIQVLERVLVANNVSFADRNHAKSILHIISIQTSNTLVTGGGVNVSGLYAAYLTVVFSVTKPDGTVLIPPTSLREGQNFTTNATQVLSGNSMAAQLASEMQQRLSQHVVNQLAKLTDVSSTTS
jgi:LPS-assembly lipoprotein